MLLQCKIDKLNISNQIPGASLRIRGTANMFAYEVIIQIYNSLI